MTKFVAYIDYFGVNGVIEAKALKLEAESFVEAVEAAQSVAESVLGLSLVLNTYVLRAVRQA